MIQLLLVGGGALAGFSGKAALEFFTPQDAADQLRDTVGSHDPLSVSAIVEHHEETQGFTWVLPDPLPTPYLSEHKVDLQHRDRETFEVIAGTTRDYCEFTIQVTGLAGKNQFTQEISNQGEPFRVTAPASYSPNADYDHFDRNAYDVVYESDFVHWRRSKG